MPLDVQAREGRLRRFARRQGYAIRKSRIRTPNLDDFGGDRIIEPNYNYIVAGPRFELDLDDLEAFFHEHED